MKNGSCPQHSQVFEIQIWISFTHKKLTICKDIEDGGDELEKTFLAN